MNRRDFIRGMAAVAVGGIVMPTRRIWQVGASLHSSASLVSPHDLEKKWARLIDGVEPKFTRRVMAMLFENYLIETRSRFPEECYEFAGRLT